MMTQRRHSIWWRLAVYPPIFAVVATAVTALATYSASAFAGAELGRTIKPDYLSAITDGAPKGVMYGILSAVVQSWRKSEWRGEPSGAKSWPRLRWLLFVPRGIQWLGISRMAMALFAALSIGLGAWMFRFGVTPTGSRSGSVYVTDRWAGQTYVCERSDCNLLILSGENAAGPHQESASVAPAESKEGQPLPEIGAVIDGYRFKGGDPSRQENWEQVTAEKSAASAWTFEPVQGDPFAAPSQQQPASHPAKDKDWWSAAPLIKPEAQGISDPNPPQVASSQNSLPPGYVLDPPPQSQAGGNIFDQFDPKPVAGVRRTGLPMAPIDRNGDQSLPTDSGNAAKWAQFPIVLPSLLPSGATSASAQSDQMWVQVPAREFLVTAPSKQKFIVNAPAGAEKYFVINIAKDEIGKLPAAARASLLPIEAGTTYDDWIVRPLHP